MTRLDEALVLELKEIMEDDFQTLVQTYFSDTESRITELEQLAKENNARQFGRTAHSIKGSSRNLGAVQLAEICLAAENNGRSGITEGNEELVEKIKTEFDLVKIALRSHL